MAPLFSCMSNEIVIRRSCGLLFIVMTLLVSNSNQHPWPHGYELIYATDETTELTGSITMTCRSSSTAENVPLNEVQFWLNGSTCNTNGTSLRERTNVNVLEVDKYRIKFNLTRDLEGYYTCGTRIDENCVTSSQRELISFQLLIPMPGILLPTLSYTRDRVVLPCPIQPGALLQYYSVIWMKNSTKIAEVINPHDVMTTDGRYSIDSPTLALIIDPVSIDDLSTDYQCQVYATNPITGTRKQLQFYPPLTSSVRLSLTLTVKANIGN